MKPRVKTASGTNSGIYFHTVFQEKDFPHKGCEVQINNTARDQGSGYTELKKTGSLYGLRNVYKPVVEDGQWFTLRLEMRAKHVRVWVNGTLLTDYVEPSNPEGHQRPQERPQAGPRDDRPSQCHDANGRAEFRNLRLRRLPDSEPSDVIPGKYDELDRQIVELNRGNFPLVDFHIHLKGGLTLEEALDRSRRLGINYGIAFNCGIGFPITNDAGIEAVLKTVKGAPCFIGMQAEGREWTKMFSKEAIARFDYVFTDGMTLANLNGKRARLWVKGEYTIGDKQAFMELLVKSIVGILDDEPIDIYANPLFIPRGTAAGIRPALDACAPATGARRASAQRRGAGDQQPLQLPDGGVHQEGQGAGDQVHDRHEQRRRQLRPRRIRAQDGEGVRADLERDVDAQARRPEAGAGQGV